MPGEKPLDSCAENNGGCHHECQHSPSGPVCTCHHGFRLLSDQKSCEGSFIVHRIYSSSAVCLMCQSSRRVSEKMRAMNCWLYQVTASRCLNDFTVSFVNHTAQLMNSKTGKKTVKRQNTTDRAPGKT